MSKPHPRSKRSKVAPGPRKARRDYRTPVLFKVDLKAGDVSWAEFAGDKGPDSDRGRHLVAAAWLSQQANVKTITPVHLFACYKSVGWAFHVDDPTASLRALQQEGLGTFHGGTFRINRHGLAEVENMTS